jgi:hypothetical protein
MRGRGEEGRREVHTVHVVNSFCNIQTKPQGHVPGQFDARVM